MKITAYRLWVLVFLGIVALLPAGSCGGKNNTAPATTPAPCTCGCMESDAMIAELRQEGGQAALARIDTALAEIADREARGLSTDKMMAHRQRLQELAAELKSPR